jgi:hypothetical protein
VVPTLDEEPAFAAAEGTREGVLWVASATAEDPVGVVSATGPEGTSVR